MPPNVTCRCAKCVKCKNRMRKARHRIQKRPYAKPKIVVTNTNGSFKAKKKIMVAINKEVGVTDWSAIWPLGEDCVSDYADHRPWDPQPYELEYEG